MLHIPIPIVTSHISVRLLIGNNLVNLFLDSLPVVLESEKNWANISLLDFCEFCPVLLLLWESVLVSFDLVVFVILDACKSNDTLLDVISHHLPVNVHSLLVILLEIAIFYKFK